MAYDPELADRIRFLLDGTTAVTEKRMFGGDAFMISGHLAVAASREGGLLLRCQPDRTAALLTEPGAGTMIMNGREMVGWLRVDHDAVAEDVDLRRWLAVGTDYVATLPAKT